MIWITETKACITAVLASFLLGMLMDMLLKRLTGSEQIRYVAVVAAIITATFIGAYGMSQKALVCILSGQVLLFAAEYDYATHLVPDYLPVLLLLVGLIQVDFSHALPGLFAVPLPFLVAAFLKEGSIGGGDIKLMAACGFILGVKKGYAALLAGLFLAILLQATFGKKEDKGFALVPYLSVGCLLAMLPTQ